MEKLQVTNREEVENYLKCFSDPKLEYKVYEHKEAKTME